MIFRFASSRSVFCLLHRSLLPVLCASAQLLQRVLPISGGLLQFDFEHFVRSRSGLIPVGGAGVKDEAGRDTFVVAAALCFLCDLGLDDDDEDAGGGGGAG